MQMEGFTFLKWLMTLYYISLQAVELCFRKTWDQFRNTFHIRSVVKLEERTAPAIVRNSKSCQSSDIKASKEAISYSQAWASAAPII